MEGQTGIRDAALYFQRMLSVKVKQACDIGPAGQKRVRVGVLTVFILTFRVRRDLWVPISCLKALCKQNLTEPGHTI